MSTTAETLNAIDAGIPSIYVACLASYNDGILYGAWIEATDADEIREGVANMLRLSPVAGAEEWAIHDFENFGSVDVGEFASFDDLAELGANIVQADELAEVYTEWVALQAGNTIDYATFEENYSGSYTDVAEWAQEWFEETEGEVPSSLASFIDWERYGQELLWNYIEISDSEGVTHLFLNV